MVSPVRHEACKPSIYSVPVCTVPTESFQRGTKLVRTGKRGRLLTSRSLAAWVLAARVWPVGWLKWFSLSAAAGQSLASFRLPELHHWHRRHTLASN